MSRLNNGRTANAIRARFVKGLPSAAVYDSAMVDSRLPLTIRSVPSGFSLVFADGGQHVFVHGHDTPGVPSDGSLSNDEALELAKEVARALLTAWGAPWRSAA